jgi:3'(2'), 5'-bisphosphate nucleotidase
MTSADLSSNLSSQDLHALCEQAIAVAKQASDAIMAIYAGEFSVQHKADQSPLTLADTTAHQIIERGLKLLVPRFPMLSEESPERVFADRLRWKRFWLVDPLDGTKEFVSRNGEFTVNIALIEDGEPVLGIIAAPSQSWVAYASRGNGSFQRDFNANAETATPLKVKSCPVDRRVEIGASRSHYQGEIGALAQALGAHQFTALGSALKFVSLASGAIDLYPRLASSASEWDIAAGHCIVREAGGEVLGRDGGPLRYNLRADVLVPAFVAIGDQQHNWLERMGWLEKP